MNEFRAIVAGFSSDLKHISATLLQPARCYWVDERTPDGTPLPSADSVVYVFSPDTGYSSHLLSWFTWIHHNMQNEPELVFRLDNQECTIFPFAEKLRAISMDELRRWVDEASRGDPRRQE